MTRKQSLTLILILGALSTIGPFSIDMYLPGFPAIARDLNTSISVVQLSLTSYFIGVAVGQLLYGPLLDRFGRRIPLYVGLILYVLASIGCALVNTADGLIVMRFLQAIGGCSGMVAASALVRDLFPVEKTAQAFSWIMLVIAVSPMVAPALGGYVTAAFGWHSIFLILAAMVVLILIACHFYLPAGQGPDTSLSLRPRPVVANFVSVMRQPQFLLYTLAGGITAAALFAYIAGSADVFMNQFGASEEEYGWIFAIIACFMIGSTQLNHLLLRHFTSAQIIRTVLIGQAVVGLALVGGTAFEMLGKYEMAALIALFFTGQGLTNPNFNALSLAPFTRNTGSAASLAGSFRMAAGGVITGLVSLLYNRTPMPMIGVMVGCVGVGLVVLLVGTSMRSFKEQALGTI
jgi:DHA1 family bicyclomycin/chloramphenicol resistance-like MFS transporter